MNDWFGVFRLIATRFPRKPVVYFCLFAGWWITLWFLSANNPAPKNGPDIPHLDKVAHFGYFFIGGALLSTAAVVAWPVLLRHWRMFFVALVVVCSVIGRLDEYHQGFTLGRSGNDRGDWAADTLGGAAGAFFVLGWVLPRVRRVDKTHKKLGKRQITSNSLD